MPVWLMIVLPIVALIIIAMSIQIQFCVDYDGKFSFYAKYLFFTFSNKSHDKGKTKQKKKSKSKEKKPQKISLELLKQYLGLAEKLWEKVEPLLVKLKDKLIVNDLTANIVIGTDDAAKTAIYYGEACSIVYPIVSFIESILHVKKKNVSLNCDFNGSSTLVFSFNVGIRLISLNIIGIIVLVRTVLVLVKYSITIKKGESKNE